MISETALDAPPSFGVDAAAGHDPARGREHLELARRFLAAIEAGTTDPDVDALAFYAPDVVQEEFPNRLLPDGAVRDLDALRAAAARGRGLLRAQRYAVRHAYAVSDTVILELRWTGTLAVPVASLKPGDEMRAHFCAVLEFRDGRIARHRTYDCIEPF